MAFDPRLTPYRPDLAAESLRGSVEAPRYATARRWEVAAASLPVRRNPQPDAAQDTEALRGELVDIYDEVEGWAWGQLVHDGYVGWMGSDALRVPGAAPTHRIVGLRSFLYPGPSIKLPPAGALPFGARVHAQPAEGRFLRTADGFLWATHLAPIGTVEDDFVSVAERFLGVPYLWGGKTPLGLDCSGLVQVALGAVGRAAPRDSDMQARDLGTAIGIETVRRGDLVFWRGHVGIMRDAATLLHANGEAMAVTREPLGAALARIEAAGGGGVTAVKRL